MEGEWVRIWEEIIVTEILLGGPEENHKKPENIRELGESRKGAGFQTHF